MTTENKRERYGALPDGVMPRWMSREANRTGAAMLAGVLWPVTITGFVLIWYIEVLTPYAERCWNRLTDVPTPPPPDPYLLAASEEIDRILNPDKDKAA